LDLGLKGKVAIVTGGSDGLGRATAERLATEGGHVVICGRRAEPLRAVAETIRRGGGEALDVSADVTRPADLARLVDAAVERFGRLDVLVNNAGVSATGAFEAIDDARWQGDLELKFFAAARLARLCLPVMRRAGGGRIVNILNTGAKAPAARSMPTSVSRAAGLAFTKALSKEVAPDGILVNAVCIGIVKSGQWERRWVAAGRPGTLDDFYTAMAKERAIPVGRVGDAAELASLIAFLVSDQARYVTGVAINFDGGLADVV
jgi:NAD(P)-dependent dehydrogenase (short-subunit alcohol dehydrogenase family)